MHSTWRRLGGALRGTRDDGPTARAFFYAAVLSRLIPTREMRLPAWHLGKRPRAAAGYSVSVLGTIAHDLLSFWAELTRPPQISPRTALGGASVTLLAASIASAISHLLRVFPGARRASRAQRKTVPRSQTIGSARPTRRDRPHVVAGVPTHVRRDGRGRLG